MQTHHLRLSWQQLLYLFLLAIAVFVLLPRLVGAEHVWFLLRTANSEFVLLALMAELSRYFISAASTVVLACLFEQRVPFLPMVEAFFAGSAANRTFSTGGAPGMLIRLVFLSRNHVSTGHAATIYLIEDIAGLVIGSIVFLAGVTTILTMQSAERIVTESAILVSILSLALSALGLYFLRYRSIVERISHRLARWVSAVSERLIHRQLYTRERIQHILDDFYTGLSAARRAPQLVAIAFGLNIIRHSAGIAALYFSFAAMGQTINPGILIVIYTIANVISTTSAVPGEVAIMGTGFAILFLSLGISPDAALLALILARATAFWLPLPIGLIAFWHLRRRHYL